MARDEGTRRFDEGSITKNERAMKYIALQLASIVIIAGVLPGCSRYAGKFDDPPRRFAFREVWGYLMKGEEKEITGREPFTDVLYFGVRVNRSGRISGSGCPPRLSFSGDRPRVHLVVYRLTGPDVLHSCLGGGRQARELLIGDIAACAEKFDGIQVDFESLRPEDGPAYLDFLAELKPRLSGRMLSVAVPPRLIKPENDAYDYGALSAIADRVVVMAYDQHWETSAPGAIASLSWCGSVAAYAADYIPPEKLVMGLPLYGRAWQERKVNRAVNYRTARELMKRRGARKTGSADAGPAFEYVERVMVRVYFEDMDSLRAKLRLYRRRGVSSVAFWRIGQGPPELWDAITSGGGGLSRLRENK